MAETQAQPTQERVLSWQPPQEPVDQRGLVLTASPTLLCRHQLQRQQKGLSADPQRDLQHHRRRGDAHKSQAVGLFQHSRLQPLQGYRRRHKRNIV